MKKLFIEQSINTELVKLNIFTIPKLIKIILKERCQVVHTHLIHADILGRIAAIIALILNKHVIFTTVHDVHWFRWEKGFFYRIVRFGDFIQTLPKACHIIAISESVKDLLVQKQHYRPKKIEVLYNAIEITEGQKRIIADISSIKCLYLGRLVKEKNLSCLLRALSLLKNEPVSLTIVGEGEEESKLKSQIQELGIQGKVDFVSATLEPEKFYQSHDVFILPSSHEGLGIVILEAFHHRLPVIGSNVHGIRELLAEERGLLFEDNDEMVLAAHISTLLYKPELRSEYGQRGYEYVKINHDIREYVHRLHSLYHIALTARINEN
jgi:glycosyltransferase involved in cell wall biosynthesis